MELSKQLSIKTGSVRRLGGDYRSYAAEYDAYCRQLETAMQSADAHAVKKAREFVDECAATRLDIQLRLTEARTALETFMADNTQLMGSQEWSKAQQTLQDNNTPQQQQRDQVAAGSLPSQQPQPQLRAEPQQQVSGGGSSGSGAASAAPYYTVPSSLPSRFSVAVYGGSQVKPGDAAFERAKQLGARLAQSNFHIVHTLTLTRSVQQTAWA